eukprot:15451604-Alexandrium_andersonii.AAC.1
MAPAPTSDTAHNPPLPPYNHHLPTHRTTACPPIQPHTDIPRVRVYARGHARTHVRAHMRT